MNYESNRNVNQMQSHLCNEPQLNYNHPCSPSISLSPPRKFCGRFVTGVRGTSKLGSVRGSYLFIPYWSLPTCTGYLTYSNEFVVFPSFSHLFVIFFSIAIYGDISIYQFKDSCLWWCSQIRNTRFNLNYFTNCKLLVKLSISTTVWDLPKRKSFDFGTVLVCCKNWCLYEVSASSS